MPDYRATSDVAAQADTVFDYVSQVKHLPEYFERMTSATATDGEAVKVTAELPDGRKVEGEAWFRVNHEDQSVSWGSEGPNDYHGHLEVTADGPDECSVTVVLSTERVATEEIQAGLERTLAAIKRITEG